MPKKVDRPDVIAFNFFMIQLPSIEVVVKSPPTGRDQKLPPILVLVMCPTRELASQAATEAKKLLKYHPSLGVQVVIGGTRLAQEQKRMQANPCQVSFCHTRDYASCIRLMCPFLVAPRRGDPPSIH